MGKVAASSLRANSSPGTNLSHPTHSEGEESLWPALSLMSRPTRLFACLVLPKCCGPKAEYEPKRNILRVA